MREKRNGLHEDDRLFTRGGSRVYDDARFLLGAKGLVAGNTKRGGLEMERRCTAGRGGRPEKLWESGRGAVTRLDVVQPGIPTVSLLAGQLID